MFRVVYDCLMASYGSIGSRHTFLVDFETAAIKAINHVFTDAVVNGCRFHFRQAVYLWLWVQQEGLKSQHEDTDSPTLRQLMSFTMSPVFAIPVVWNWLKYPPATGNKVTDAKLLEHVLRAHLDCRRISAFFVVSQDREQPTTPKVFTVASTPDSDFHIRHFASFWTDSRNFSTKSSTEEYN